MELRSQIAKKGEQLDILLIGNNPIDMSRVMEKISQLHGPRVNTEIAFDVKSILDRLSRFTPNFILIDDNIGKTRLTETIDALSQSRKTRNIPITLLKNSNYQEGIGSKNILDYILKTNLSAESLYNAVRNSLKFRKTQLLLSKMYNRNRRLIAG